MRRKIKDILTGSTDMVDEVVLHKCLLHEAVENILVINCKSCGVYKKEWQHYIRQLYELIKSGFRQL